VYILNEHLINFTQVYGILVTEMSTPSASDHKSN